MSVYVLGAGASKHAGYPLAATMGKDLLQWMRSQVNSRQQYPVIADQIADSFGQIDDIDGVFERMADIIRDFEKGTPEQRITRSLVANSQRPMLTEAIRDWFLEIRQHARDDAYASFAQHVVKPGDCLLTFNYDVSLDKRLREAGKWSVGDGYGFSVDGFPCDSPTKLLKLHGSTNWLALMDGLPRRGVAQVSCVFASPRPAIGQRELDFLGYVGGQDPIFPGGRTALPAMITGRNKRFSFDTSLGSERAEFWMSLWEQAATALAETSRVVVCGYSLPPADEAACGLLLSAPRRTAQVVVLSGSKRSGEIVNQFRARGFSDVTVAAEVYFQEWVAAQHPASRGALAADR